MWGPKLKVINAPSRDLDLATLGDVVAQLSRLVVPRFDVEPRGCTVLGGHLVAADRGFLTAHREGDARDAGASVEHSHLRIHAGVACE